MFLGLAAFALLSGETPATVLEHFGASGLTTPALGLLSHLAISAIYGVLFGALIWPVLRRISAAKIVGWTGGLAYALPGTGSPLGQLPLWSWALGHAIYGLVLGGLFARKSS